MLFNSIEFALFLPFVFVIYWLIARYRSSWVNSFLLGSSYLFYGSWDWRFLILIVASSICDYLIGLNLAKASSKTQRRLLLTLSLVFNLGLLAVFKYANFFIESFVHSVRFFGLSFSASRLEIILPVGISFYTFQTLSYTIDIYRGKIQPTRSIVNFFAFVSFFPQLVAGPIERAAHLLPQFTTVKKFDVRIASDGLRQILWGFFKKVVIADNAAIIVNQVFSSELSYQPWELWYAAILFSFQIYCDFSGYSDIAIGLAKLFGFKLSKNFSFPYFSENLVEFWSRWHISLTSWFRDYVYIPLGGNRNGQIKRLRNVFVVFLVSGLWHGANWTFVFWGVLNSLIYITWDTTLSLRFSPSKISVALARPFLLISNFLVVTTLWVFFRAESINSAMSYLVRMYSVSKFESSGLQNSELSVIILFFLALEWYNRDVSFGLDIGHWSRIHRHLTYIVVVLLIFCFAIYGQQDFIYFQF